MLVIGDGWWFLGFWGLGVFLYSLLGNDLEWFGVERKDAMNVAHHC